MKEGSVAYKKILVAIDGSPASARAADHAIHLAKMEDAELTVLHVVEDIKQGGAIGLRAKYGDVSLIEAFKNVRIKAAEEFMSPILHSATSAGVSIKKEIIIDKGKSVGGTISEYAQQHKADLIVLGSRGRSGLKQLLAGSVANKVFNLAKCPVLIIQ